MNVNPCSQEIMHWDQFSITSGNQRNTCAALMVGPKCPPHTQRLRWTQVLGGGHEPCVTGSECISGRVTVERGQRLIFSPVFLGVCDVYNIK